MIEPLSPRTEEGDFKTAALEISQSMILAFEEGSFFRNDVLLEQDAD